MISLITAYSNISHGKYIQNKNSARRADSVILNPGLPRTSKDSFNPKPISFTGFIKPSEVADFYTLYQRRYDEKLNNTILQIISDKANFIGEGKYKIVYSFPKLEDYVIRVFKKIFNETSLHDPMIYGKNQNSLEKVILQSRDGGVDISKKVSGSGLSLGNYNGKLINYDTSVDIQSSKLIYQNLLDIKDFPLDTFRSISMSLKKLSKDKNYIFDIINPNNILVDYKKEKITLIDPLDLRLFHFDPDTIFILKQQGADSLCPVICDFLLLECHLNNLAPRERKNMHMAVKAIIDKCITAGQEVGLERNLDTIKEQYRVVDELFESDFHQNRISWFINEYNIL